MVGHDGKRLVRHRHLRPLASEAGRYAGVPRKYARQAGAEVQRGIGKLGIVEVLGGRAPQAQNYPTAQKK